MTTYYLDPGHASSVEDGSIDHPFATVTQVIGNDGPIFSDVDGVQTASDDYLTLCTNTDDVALGTTSTLNEDADLNGHTVEFRNANAEAYFVTTTSSFAVLFAHRTPRITKITGWHFNNTYLGTNSNARTFLFEDSNIGRLEFESCLISSGGGAFVITIATSASSSQFIFNNCIFRGLHAPGDLENTGPVGMSCRTGTWEFNNCTIIDLPRSRKHSAGTVHLRNTYMGRPSFGDVWYEPDVNHEQPETVVTSSVSDESITTTGIVQNVSVADCNFEDATIGSQDIRTTAGSALHDAGTNIGPAGTEAVDYTDDHYGTPRGSTWDIGAFEYVDLSLPLPRLFYGKPQPMS